MSEPLDLAVGEASLAAMRAVVGEAGTPAYVYFLDAICDRVAAVRGAMAEAFDVSYAIKSNPNIALLSRLKGVVDSLDASSGGEVSRAGAAGWSAERVSFSGPAKRPRELEQALAVNCGLMVAESLRELTTLNEYGLARGRAVPVAVRINPRTVPRRFGVNMAGKPSQFGIDEEDMPQLASRFQEWPGLSLRGFHIYSGTNSLSEEAIAENFDIFVKLFEEAAELCGVEPQVLIFGSGFGIPYHDGQQPLKLDALGSLVAPVVSRVRVHRRLGGAKLVLEMGRYLVGPAGFFLTRVIGTKKSRGAEICLCDGGFNNHLAAFGLMGTVIRRNWPMWNLTPRPGSVRRKYTLVGPLCTTIDLLAQDVELDEVSEGDVIAVGASGAYGLTASPLYFISHPLPQEWLIDSRSEGSEGGPRNVTEIFGAPDAGVGGARDR